MKPDYGTGMICLQENLAKLAGPFGGNPTPENHVMWNITTALTVVLQALQDIDVRLTNIEHQK